MADIDPDTLLEWLTMGAGDERDMQVIALEQLCMLLLMSDNVDRCFESCPPRSFLPALCHIFMDESAPVSILEVTARAITYYLDVSAECSRRIVTVDGAVKALCTRLVVVDISSRASKDLAEQCVKVLELMCTREAGSIYESGGLNCMLTFIREYGTQIHKDTLHSAMSVVARLCGKMEPTDDTLEGCMDSLSKLLQHEDTYVADVALKCFACLADRFTRRGVDPAPLAKHGLTEELLKKLVSSALACNLNTSTNLNASISESRSSSGNVSIIVSVLSMLCRGSPTVTHDLLRSTLPDAIETAMKGDERCVLDTMRLVDLLLILLFEGRNALPKSALPSSRGSLSGLRKLDSTGDKSHRQLIDCIRSKDTDALVEAIDASTFDVNFMDDVGQTLLNWASAFGTLEMVEFLCERGADVNRGQRSSSLHYAACFGRPAVAKVLLHHGANPELRDEDGKTPLDKARERNDEGHKEVVHILQSPGEWMAASIDYGSTTQIDKSSSDKPTVEDTEGTSSYDKEEAGQTEVQVTVKGDPEMAPIYVKRLVPVFANTYQASLVQSIKKATLSILKKMIHFIPASMMEELVSGNVAPQLVDVIAMALSTEGDDEGHLTAFFCVQDLMSKGSHIFLIHFIRLGVLQKITEMASEAEEFSHEDLIDGKIMQKEESTIPLEDATKILPSRPYHWHDWCIVRGRDCLYLWSDFCAVELSNGSNGWFRFVLDCKLATMYSSGSPEGGSSSSESRTEFLDKLQRARSAVSPTAVSQPILSSTKAETITVGNWTLNCRQENQLVIINTDGQQATVLKEDLPGFLFESNRGTKHTFTAETSLGPAFASSWNGNPGKKFQSKKERIHLKSSSMAHSLYCKYFKDADLTPHGSTAVLHKISDVLNACAQPNEPMTEENRLKIYNALKQLCNILQEESMLSSYEVQTSGLVTALNNCLNKSLPLSSSLTIIKEHSYTDTFKQVFGEIKHQISGDESLQLVSSAVTLVRKLITVLESLEKLPVLTYESLGGGSGLQILLRRLRFKLERGEKSVNFIDRSGRFIKMEPLTTVKEVQKYMLTMVAKQWFDYERGSFNFVQYFKDNSEPLIFTYEKDFDENGVLYWLGTNAKTVTEWVNPARHNIVIVNSSEGRSLPYGRIEDVISRDSSAVNCHTNDDKAAWFSVNLGVYVVPTKYTLRHARGYGRSALRNWYFQVSNDSTTWITIKCHENDDSLQEPGSTATWILDLPKETEKETLGWHMVRIQQNGTNASGQTYYLSVSGMEIYGKVTAVVSEMKDVPASEGENNQKRQRRVLRSQILRQMALGAKEGSDWKLLRQQARAKAMAQENQNNSGMNDGWVDVSWAQNMTASATSKNNTENNFNVKVVDVSDPDVQAKMLGADKEENESNNTTHQTTLDSALRQVVMSFGKHNRNARNETKSLDKTTDKLSRLNSGSSTDEANETTVDTQSGSCIDLANLQFLMAVEDLLDSSSSDLVASALADAASMHVDQLRLATRSFRSTLLESKSRPTPSAQGSRESRSPPTELNTPLLSGTNTPSNELTTPSSELGIVTELPEVSHLEEINESVKKETKKDIASNVVADNDSNSFKLTKEECMSQIQKITSSMSEVLESMTSGSSKGRSHDLEVDFVDNASENTLSVAENNFLNDNHSVLEPNVISLLNDGNESPLSDDDDDEDEDEDDDDDDDNEQLESSMIVREDMNEINYKMLSSVTKDSINAVETIEHLVKKETATQNISDVFSNNLPSADTTVSDASVASKARELSQEAINAMMKLLQDDEDSETIDRVTEQALQFLGEQNEPIKITELLNNIMQSNAKKIESTPDSKSEDLLEKNVNESIYEDLCTGDVEMPENRDYGEENKTEEQGITVTGVVEYVNEADVKNEQEVLPCGVLESIYTTVGKQSDIIVGAATKDTEPFNTTDTKVKDNVTDVTVDEVGDKIDADDTVILRTDDINVEESETKSADAVLESRTDTTVKRTEIIVDTADTMVEKENTNDKLNTTDTAIDATSDKVDVPETLKTDLTTNESKTDDNGMFSLEEIIQLHQLSKTNEKLSSKENKQGSTGESLNKDLYAELTDNGKSSKGDSKTLKDDVESVEDMDINDGEDEEDEDDDDDDDDDDFDDIENEDENEAEDMYEPMQTHHHHERRYDHQRRMWDDDLVLKCHHAALVPAFDPRPGRTNVQQTQDIEIPSSDALREKSVKKDISKIQLYLRGTPSAGGKEVEVLLDNPNATVFSYVQSLVLHGSTGPTQNERLRRVWEPTYTIVYKSTDNFCEKAIDTPTESDLNIKWPVSYVKDNLGKLELPKSDVINYLQQNCSADFLKKWKLIGSTRLCRKQRNCSVLASAYKEFAELKSEEESSTVTKENFLQIEEPIIHKSLEDIAPIQQVLDVVKALHRLSDEVSETVSLSDEYLFDVPSDEFLSKKLTNKLVQQIQDPLALTAGSLPLWCEYLVINYPTLFPFETRQMFFKATAFGCSRSIVCLQNMQDAALERTRGHPARRLETHEFRIGRLKHERVRVPRGDKLLDTAIRLIEFHAEKKAVLEIEFKDEEGTGLGPSLEFYALISLAIQQNNLLLWVSIDETVFEDSEEKSNLMKYSRHPNGLFPAPFPQDSDHIEQICKLFSFLGIFLAKCLQDSRLVDIPLSEPFFKMLCAGKGKYSRLSRTLSQTSELTDNLCVDDDSVDDVFDISISAASVEKLDSHYFSNVLTDCDFELIHPNKAKFIKLLKLFIEKRNSVLYNCEISAVERQHALDKLMFVTEHGHECKLEDLGLSFLYIPSSTVYGFSAGVELKPGGAEEMLNAENAEEYIKLLTDFVMHKGIAKQLEAFRAGFNRVFPMEKLHAFKPREIQLMLCGEQAPKWTYDELLQYTEPKFGYHKESPGFLRLINVLVAMNGEERKSFLQFATGCSSLPPGGIANLHPRLTVVKKEDEGDGSFPSVNTCVHYLKLPEYSSEQVLLEKLLAATMEKGFHLN